MSACSYWRFLHNSNNGLHTPMSFVLLSLHPVSWSIDDVMSDRQVVDTSYSSRCVQCNECNALIKPPDTVTSQWKGPVCIRAIARPTCVQTARGFAADCCWLSCPLNYAQFHRFSCILSAFYLLIYVVLSCTRIVNSDMQWTCDNECVSK